MNKAIALISMTVLMMSACNTIQNTATTIDLTPKTHSVTVADLKVGERITYTMTPSKDVRRGGEENVKRVVEAEALMKKGGNADLLLEPQYMVTKKRGLFGSKITSISVTGRPASYTNFRSLPDSVWSNPVFRGVKYIAVPGKPSYSSKKGNKGYVAKPVIMRKAGTWDCRANVALMGLLGDSFYEDYALIPVTFNALYNLTPRWAVGIGAGIHIYTEDGSADCHYPISAILRHNFSSKEKSWFVEAQVGCVFPGEENVNPGPTTQLEVGYSFKNWEIALRGNYTYMDIDDVIDSNIYGIGPSVSWKF